MFWAFLAGIGAFSNAAYFIVNKRFLQDLNPNQLAASGFLCTSGILLSCSFITGFPAVGPEFFGAVVVTTLLNILGTTLTFRALSSSDISLSIPMLSFTPIFLVGTAALLLGEFPSVAGILGIFIIVSGSYILNTATEHERITDPFRSMISHPGVMAMLVVAFLYAISINFDKIVVQTSNPVFGSGIVFLLLGTSFAVLATLEKCGRLPAILCSPRPAMTGQTPAPPSAPWRYLAGAGVLTSILMTIEAVSINTAYLLQIAPYVIAIKRMSLILIVLYGTLIFREKEIVRRLAGAGLMVLGAVLILVFP